MTSVRRGVFAWKNQEPQYWVIMMFKRIWWDTQGNWQPVLCLLQSVIRTHSLKSNLFWITLSDKPDFFLWFSSSSCLMGQLNFLDYSTAIYEYTVYALIVVNDMSWTVVAFIMFSSLNYWCNINIETNQQSSSISTILWRLLIF